MFIVRMKWDGKKAKTSKHFVAVNARLVCFVAKPFNLVKYDGRLWSEWKM